MRLLVERARAAGAAIEVTDDTAADLTALVTALDGLPLALELAAARLRVLSAGELVARLEPGAAGLGRAGPDRPERQRTLAATLDWSHRLLEPVEQRLFAELSVFRGGFVVADVEAVTTISGDVVDHLAALVDHSLLHRVTGTAGRLAMLQVVGEYAASRLVADGRRDEVAARHADRLAAVAEQHATALRDHDDEVARDWFVVESHNLRAALRWAASAGDDRRLLRLVSAVAIAWTRTDSLEELQWLRRAAAVGDDPATAVGADPTAAVDQLAVVHVALANLALRRGHLDESEDWARRVEVTPDAQRRLATWVRQQALLQRSMVASHRGDEPTADRLLDDALALGAERDGSTYMNAFGQVYLADRHMTRERWREALVASERSVAMFRELGHRFGELTALCNLALASLRLGDVRRAATSWRAALDGAAERGSPTSTVLSLEGLAAVAVHEGRLDDARGLLAEADEAADTHGVVGGAPEQQLRTAVDDTLAGAGSPPPAPTGATGTASAGTAADVRGPSLAGDARGNGRAAATSSGGIGDGEAQRALRTEGAVWAVTFDGRTVRVGDRKGMTDLAALLAAPGREIAAMDLMDAAVVADDLGPDLDRRARQEVEQRIRDLQLELVEAEDGHDLVRAERARDEMDRLVSSLAAATGIGGRGRRRGGTAERARSAVTWRIRAAIRAVAELHPDAGAHLDSSVRTGRWCLYEPVTPGQWEVLTDVDPSGGHRG